MTDEKDGANRLKQALAKSLFVKRSAIDLSRLRGGVSGRSAVEDAPSGPSAADLFASAASLQVDDLAGLDDISKTLDILTTAGSLAGAGAPAPASDEERRRYEIMQKLVKNFSRSPEAEKLKRSSGVDVAATARAFFEEHLPAALTEANVTMTRNVRAEFVTALVDEATGFGPLASLLDDPEISEIMVNGPRTIFIERSGRLTVSEVRFFNEEHLFQTAQKIAAKMGRQLDLANPILEARLPDGSRVQAVAPPLSLDGTSLTIRKFKAVTLQMEDMIQYGALTSEMAYFLGACVKARLNILVAGGTGSGKTTMLNVLSTLVQPGQRMVTIEDAAELKVRESHPHVVRLETRAASSAGGGRGGVSIRELVKSSLRMRPDRVIVGECRGGEALDMLQAMNTGHDGSMTTAHANSAREMIQRLETMCLMSGVELPALAIRGQIASAIELIVHLRRYADGSRKVGEISEVLGIKDGQVELRQIFWYDVKGRDASGRVEGEFRVAETPPKFVHKFEAEGLNFPYEIFTGGVSNLAPDAAPPLEVPSVPLSVIQSFTVDLGQIGFASTWAMGVLSAWGFPSERLPETELALAEAVGNVARHSGLVETRGVLSILVAADATGFSITVIDEGKPFDSATAEIREREGDTEHGMGLGLIRTLVDGVSYEYRDGANRLTIRLLRNKP